MPKRQTTLEAWTGTKQRNTTKKDASGGPGRPKAQQQSDQTPASKQQQQRPKPGTQTLYNFYEYPLKNPKALLCLQLRRQNA